MTFNSRSLSRIVPVLGQQSSGSESDMDSISEQVAKFDFFGAEQVRFHFPGAVRKFAYRFDGYGKFVKKEWDLMREVSDGFCWYHVELPRSSQKLSMSAEYLIDVLCPPLKLQEILALVSSGPFCGTVDGALVFRVNSAGPCARVGNLLVHIIDTHVDQLHEIVLQLETELDEVERDLDIGVGATKKQMLDDRRFPKMHLNLQRLLQVIAHGDQVFPRVKDKCAGKSWCSSEDLTTLEALVGRLRKLKENVGFIVSRITAIQAGLDSWQAEQINRKLYYLSFLSMLFLPLSIVTGAFGMNVGGVPWTTQTNPKNIHGFRNIMLICAVIVLLLLTLFGAAPLYNYLISRSRQGARDRRLRSQKSIRYLGGSKRRSQYLPL
uniref:Uncharacterized protein n=1 Tax=Physcomitrium patens TaxID=3218 RepID=A0A2K1K285_PHYPA|nr:hypothetical protein PHYPA_012358 [Physcomitrium patens]